MQIWNIFLFYKKLDILVSEQTLDIWLRHVGWFIYSQSINTNISSHMS